MMQIGYTLGSEEHGPRELVRWAQRAEAAGFDFLSISDHYHPWTNRQGNSPFVWGTIGGVAATTDRIRLGTGVTCPLIRIHPAVVAQAAATAATHLGGDRFFLGVGTGEALNEHITGSRWPNIETRLAMLEEAVEIMRRLWTGESVDYDGRYYTVENARIYTRPEQPPPIIVSATGKKAAEVAARIGDGLWSTSPNKEVVDTYRAGGGKGPIIGELTLCWGPDADAARKTAYEIWPTAGVPGQLSQDLPTPSHFEQAASLVTEDLIAQSMPCGPDLDAIVDKVKAYEEAGFDHVHLHQIGPDQDGFLDVWSTELRQSITR